MEETKVSIKLDLDTSEAMKKIDELLEMLKPIKCQSVDSITGERTTIIQPITISLKDGVSEEEVLESVKNSISRLEIPKENDISEFKKAEYKDLLIKERIKKYPGKSYSEIINLEHEFKDETDDISEIKMTLEKLSLS